jgi:D-serine deaminase-like pyridoxal phosphate-dependent protein
MYDHSYEVGLSKDELDTPALLLDLDVMERNLRRMAAYFAQTPVKLRPHVKLHKATPALSHLQLNAGAVGLTCAKLAEAELLVASGIHDVLIANQIVGARKIQRLVNLSAQADIMVTVDNADNVREISQAAAARGVELRILVEVNIGHNRCGVAPFEPALELSRLVTSQPNLRYMGLAAYDGQNTIKVDPAEREPKSLEAYRTLIATRRYLEDAGIPISIVSTSGTFTYRYAAALEGVTEIQAGTYLLMDNTFRDKGVTEFDCALSVLGTVTSRPSYPGGERFAIIDVGRKAMDIAWGLPGVLSPTGAVVTSLSQEHGKLQLSEASITPRVGDNVELSVSDANNTINLYDKFYALRGGIVEAVWDIPGRGKST